MTRLSPAKGFLIGIGLGVVATLIALQLGPTGVGWTPSSTTSADRTHADTDLDSVARLEHQLDAEVRARSDLAARVAQLADELARLQAGSGNEDSIRERVDGPESDSTAPAEQAGQSLSNAAGTHFNEDALLAQGVHPRDVDRLRESWVRHELDRAALTDRALREGWFLNKRRGMEMAQLERAFREELQDEDYDRVLYARGEPNRLRAREVLEGSTASDAGLLPGDVIVRYGDTRIFKPGDLLLASSRGAVGERVTVEVLRNGRRQTVRVNRGPLGVLTEHTRGAPLAE